MLEHIDKIHTTDMGINRIRRNLKLDTADVVEYQTQELISAFSNAATLSIYPENDIETYRDVLYYTAQVLGCFCCINREGGPEVRKYGFQAGFPYNIHDYLKSGITPMKSRRYATLHFLKC